MRRKLTRLVLAGIHDKLLSWKPIFMIFVEIVTDSDVGLVEHGVRKAQAGFVSLSQFTIILGTFITTMF